MRLAGAILAALLLTACQQAPVSRPPTAVSAAGLALAEGDQLMAKGDHAGAIEKYRQAVDLEPDAVRPHFALGTAYSFLERRPAAIAQFTWVLSHADSGANEYQEAYRWLARVGALPAAATAEATQAVAPASSDPATLGRIVGRTEWPGVTPQKRLITGHLTLMGDEPTTRDINRTRPFRLGDVYEFQDVPAGRYRVLAVIDETTVWEEKVTVEANKDTSLVLQQSGSSVAVERFASLATGSTDDHGHETRPE
ncbi:MAG TPA: tetratricopeptide repeat protein [Methylomirabilota bacterium]|nr:tetratricopeptide repeat protein [Methylomirabilota bacterium]